MTDCDGSVDVELSGMSTAFLVYISQIEPIMQGIHFPDNSHPGTRYQLPRSKRRLDNFSSRLYGSRKRKVDSTSSMLQCASYALEMMSHGGLRSHVISALVADDVEG